MFKANLINSPQYYKVRRFALIMFLYPGALVVVVVGQLPWYWAVPVFLLAMGIDLWKIKVNKQAKALSTGHRIEISDEAIRILSDSGEVVEALNVADASGILVKDAYGIPGDTFSGFFKEVQGKTLQNFIVYQAGTQKVRYDFVIESNYMIEQLKKIIQNWQEKGIVVGMAERG
ncbi:MAG: hypothetical protein HUU01_00125 [Saprospiraceae bacterium]|nr:hypothetical protein [Saprospiraceae bacterium]